MHKVFNLVNRYIILATPLILFSLISSVYTAVSLINTKVANLIISIILFILFPTNTVLIQNEQFQFIKSNIY